MKLDKNSIQKYNGSKNLQAVPEGYAWEIVRIEPHTAGLILFTVDDDGQQQAPFYTGPYWRYIDVVEVGDYLAGGWNGSRNEAVLY